MEEIWASWELRDDVATCIYGMRVTHVLLRRGSELVFKPYELGSYFRLCDNGSGRNRAKGVNLTIHVGKDPLGTPHVGGGEPELWSLSGATGLAGVTKCSRDASGRTVCPNVGSTEHRWTVHEHQEGVPPHSGHNDFETRWGRVHGNR